MSCRQQKSNNKQQQHHMSSDEMWMRQKALYEWGKGILLEAIEMKKYLLSKVFDLVILDFIFSQPSLN